MSMIAGREFNRVSLYIAPSLVYVEGGEAQLR